MTSVLELNDCALALYTNGELRYAAPAVALVQPKAVLFGDAAMRQARIHPRQANQQYLARLNADPLPQPAGNAANHADLVYLHLQELADKIDNDLILAVPGITSNDQLGVLLGILQEAGVTVSGFVDAATAASSEVSAPARTYHVDLHLQRACVTRLAVNDHVQREASEEVAEAGLANVLDSWVNVIADRFVRDTRFDPLHAAETEQQLYNQVYDWVLGPGSDALPAPAHEIGIDIDYHDHVRHVDITRGVLEDKGQQRFARIIEVLPKDAHVTLSARCASLPGFKRGLKHAGHAFTVLDADALARGCVNQIGAIRSPDGPLRVITKLPHGQGQAVTPSPTPPSALPTHLVSLATGRAAPVQTGSAEQPFSIRRNEDGVRLVAADDVVRVNGRRPGQDAQLHCGDEITHGEARYLLIRVED